MNKKNADPRYFSTFFCFMVFCGSGCMKALQLFKVASDEQRSSFDSIIIYLLKAKINCFHRRLNISPKADGFSDFEILSSELLKTPACIEQ